VYQFIWPDTFMAPQRESFFVYSILSKITTEVFSFVLKQVVARGFIYLASSN
jgi:hypothetical protein